MRVQLFALVFGVACAFVMIWLLRHRIVRERFAVTWLFIAFIVGFFAIFQDAYGWLATQLRVENPTNLAFFVAALVLLLISVQHSIELSRVEEKCRILAEEVAILQAELGEGADSSAGSAPLPQGEGTVLEGPDGSSV